MIILASTFSDKTGEVPVYVDILADLPPEGGEGAARKLVRNFYVRMVTLGKRGSAYGTLPVKLMPARSGDAVIALPKTGPSAGTKFTTPGGTPASRQTWKIVQLDNSAVSLGFHSTALP